MTFDDEIYIEYFEWICSLVGCDETSPESSYRTLLFYLNTIEFTYSIPKDENRAKGGEELRYRFTLLNDREGAEDQLYGPCSVLEMMVALAIRCEENIMDDPNIGDRTGQWFWGMITNLGLGSMTDNRFDERYVDDVIYRFLNREYEPNGKGGLFTIRHGDYDMRDLELWAQMCFYLDDILGV